MRSSAAPYVESKPFHKSQKVEQRFRDGSIQLSLKVVINNELERLILGYGGHAEVIAPPEFRQRIAASVRKAASRYADRHDEIAPPEFRQRIAASVRKAASRYADRHDE